MATLIVETGAGLSNANSYATLAEANTYHETRLHVSDWTSASDANKETALMWATRSIDNMIHWNGAVSTDDQALQWPREGVIDRNGNAIENDEIPTFLKYATSEFARLLIASDRMADSDTAGFKELEVGTLRIVVDKYDRAPFMPATVWDMIKFYGTKYKTAARMLERA